MFSSHLRLARSRTRQEERAFRSASLPPQTATVGFGSAVVNNVCAYLGAGNGGGEQPLVLGNTSLEERMEELSNSKPPVKRATVSSKTGGASVPAAVDVASVVATTAVAVIVAAMVVVAAVDVAAVDVASVVAATAAVVAVASVVVAGPEDLQIRFCSTAAK